MGRAVGFVIVAIVVAAVFWFFEFDKIGTVVKEELNQNWKTITNPQGVTFQYPEKLGTTYISAVEWPPEISLIKEKFVCVESGTEVSSNGQIQKVTVENKTYCLTKQAEGAAGSTYIKYTYTSALASEMLATVKFDLRFVQCANYDEPKKGECEVEREKFDINSIINSIVKTI